MPTNPSRPGLWQPWTRLEKENATTPKGPLDCLAAPCQKTLLSIGHLFKEVIMVLISEAEFDENNPVPGVQRVTAEDVADLKETLVLCDEDYLRFLADTSCLVLWYRLACNLMGYQGIDSGNATWAMAKQRAYTLLLLWDDISSKFGEIQDELRSSTVNDAMIYGSINNAIEGKLRALERFVPIYNRIPTRGSQLASKFYGKNRKQSVVSHAYSQVQENRKATLIGVVGLVITMCIIPMVLAWRSATSLPGATSDADFWLLIQSTALQLLGLFTAIYPIFRKSTAHAWIWTWIFAAAGASCAVAAIPLYLYIPTIWSALLSFLGAVAQAYMGLQLAILVDTPLVGQKD